MKKNKIIRVCPLTGGAWRFFTEDGTPEQSPSGTIGTQSAEEAGVNVFVTERACSRDNQRKTYGTFMEVTVVEFPNGVKHFL